MHVRLTRVVAVLASATSLALPGAAFAADPASSAPPADVASWQAHLVEMQARGDNLGAHVRHHVEMHGSLAGFMGPNGDMVQMMGAMGQ